MYHGVSKYFSIIMSPSNEYSGLISFRSDWLDLPAVQGTQKSLLQYHGSKASTLWRSAFFTVQLSHPYMTGKTIALTRQTFVSQVMSLLFNIVSKFINSFSSKEQVSFNFTAAVTIISDFEAQENKSVTVSIVSSSICHEVMGPDAMIFGF